MVVVFRALLGDILFDNFFSDIAFHSEDFFPFKVAGHLVVENFASQIKSGNLSISWSLHLSG
jgi:hypothetical protein